MKPFVLILLLVLVTPILRAEIVAELFPPAKFTSLYIERDEKGAQASVQLVGDTVIYKVTLGNKILESRTAHPSGDDWFNFIQGLNNAKVYMWAPKYEYPGQGPYWVIDLVMEDRKFNSAGKNDYPKNGDEPHPQADPKAGPSIPFQLFWQSVLNLVGKIPPPPPGK
jgi:hypothetical protein